MVEEAVEVEGGEWMDLAYLASLRLVEAVDMDLVASSLQQRLDYFLVFQQVMVLIYEEKAVVVAF